MSWKVRVDVGLGVLLSMAHHRPLSLSLFASDVARFFQKYHAEHFIIINLSGEVYDYSKFQYRVKVNGTSSLARLARAILHGYSYGTVHRPCA